MIRVCLAVAYLSLALVAATLLWLAVRFDSQRQMEEQSPGGARFADVRVSEGATLRVEGGGLELVGPKPPGSGPRFVGFVRGPGVPERMLLLPAALCGSTLTLAVMVVALVRRERDRARAAGPDRGGV